MKPDVPALAGEAVRAAGAKLVSLMPEALAASLEAVGFVAALAVEVERLLTPEPPVDVQADKVILDGFVKVP